MHIYIYIGITYIIHVSVTRKYIVMAAAVTYAMFNFALRIRHLGLYLISPYGFRSLINRIYRFRPLCKKCHNYNLHNI